MANKVNGKARAKAKPNILICVQRGLCQQPHGAAIIRGEVRQISRSAHQLYRSRRAISQDPDDFRMTGMPQKNDPFSRFFRLKRGLLDFPDQGTGGIHDLQPFFRRRPDLRRGPVCTQNQAGTVRHIRRIFHKKTPRRRKHSMTKLL